MVPTFTTPPIGQCGAQLYPGSIATTTPQSFTVASRPANTTRPGDDPPRRTAGQALQPAPIPQIRAGTTLTGLQSPVPFPYPPWPSLPDPAPLAEPNPPPLFGAASP